MEKLDYELCKKYANALPGAEHTRMRELDDLENGMDSESSEDVIVCNFGDKPKEAGILLSVKRNSKGILRSYYAKGGYSHALIIGSTGSGKSQGYICNTVMNANGNASYFIGDPKGEIYRATYYRLCEVYGPDNVKTINFMQPELSDFHINYLCVLARKLLDTLSKTQSSSIRKRAWEHVESEVRKYCDVLFLVSSQRDPTWEVTARDFICAILLGLFEDLTLEAEEEKRTKRCRTTPEIINFTTVSKIFYSFKWNRYGFNEGGFFKSRSAESVALKYAKAVLDNADTTRANYFQFVSNYLKSVTDPRIAEISAYNDFNIESMGDRPQAIFFIYDISDEALRDFVNKVLAQCVNLLLESTHKKVEPLDTPVLFLIDEFPTLKPNPVYPNLLATGRGSNIYLHMVVQSYTQLASRYPEEHKAMIDNCPYTYFIGTNDAETAKKFSTELGLTTIPDPVKFQQGMFSTLTVPIVTQDNLMHRMKEGEAYIKAHRHQPIRGFFEFFHKTAEYAQYSSAEQTMKQNKPKNQKPNISYDAPWMHAQNNDDEDDDDDDDDLLNILIDEENKKESNDEDNEDEEKIITLETLYSSDFNMQESINHIPNVEKLAEDAIANIPDKMFPPTWCNVEQFENICMDLIEKIVKMNKNWSRKDAMHEAAKELVAVRSADQSQETLDVHARVLYEFSISTDDEYLLLRKQIFEE